MKNLIKGAISIALIGIVMIGCEKESTNPMNVNGSTDNKTVTENNKSAASDMEDLAQAANIDGIVYSSGDYNLTFFDISGTYNVQIVSFDVEESIEYTVTEPNGATTDITIDIINEIVGIDGVGEYTFAQYENFEVSSDVSRMKNIMAVVTVHHSLEPTTSAYYGDNGTSGVFPQPGAARWKKFWKNSVTRTPCSGGTYDYTNNWERFWIFSGTQSGTLPC